MPTYDYECEACGHRLELFQSITAKPKRTCPECGKRRLRRLIGGGAAILFKGEGFYETDYRSEEYRKAAKKETQGDSKPAPKEPGRRTGTKSSGAEGNRASGKGSKSPAEED